MKKLFVVLGILMWVISSGTPVVLAEQSAKSKSDLSSELSVDLNHATKQELAELPGIGDTVAERVIAYREENGDFQKIEEIMNVKGIGEKTFLKLKDNLTVKKGSNRGKEKK
jgi:competence protein ComEA